MVSADIILLLGKCLLQKGMQNEELVLLQIEYGFGCLSYLNYILCYIMYNMPQTRFNIGGTCLIIFKF